MNSTRSLLSFALIGVLSGATLTACPKGGTTTAVVDPTTMTPGAAYSAGVKLLQTPDKSGVVDYSGANALFTKAAEGDPSHAEAHYNAGWTAERLGNLSEAETHYRSAVNAKQGYTRAVLALAAVLSKEGSGAEAVTLYEGYLEQNPTDSTVRSQYITALASAGSYDQAIDQVRQVLRTTPDDVGSYRSLSSIYYAKGDYRMSQLCAEKAKTLAEGDAGIYNNIGVTYLTMDNEPAAIKEFKTALKLTPSNYDANMNLGFTALNSGDYELAKRCFDAALKARAGDFDAMIGEAVAMRGVKDNEGASKIYDQLLKAQPTNWLVVHNAATFKFKYEKDWKDADTILDSFIEKSTGQIGPDHEVYALKDKIQEAKAAEEKRKAEEEEKKRQEEERIKRQKENLEKLKTSVADLDKKLTTYANCQAMVESGAIDMGTTLVEQAKEIVSANEYDMASDVQLMFDDLVPQIDAIVPTCSGAAAPPGDGAAPPADGAAPPADGAAPAEGSAPPADGAPAGGDAPAPAAGGQ